ncbi:L10-interacting MYB domain-containing protein-like [Cornus florida]|uniref:L10-interacting MYB domain-containing protein-like n=1 Tax=Cornus florida TaxID=4283 RepID=UPI00289A64C4|nr:L10-interacting MYB domain-containing protein-like [Cornus florida]XP_059668636.1 L10-interacting MYB domain-containing protein-like [Cornus florida]
MGEDSCSSSDNLRANWTPSMDHYFIELLLDQVRRGNKTGNLFSKQAWAEMIALFNSNFGFRHDTDVLKNRYKRLRKLYNDIKILNQNGFSWDVKQRMVTADDHVWDDYIKVHPDMLTYRTRVVPYYDELCMICGHAVADGRYSLSCFDIDYDNEAKTLDDQNPSKNDHTKIEWSQTMDEHFIQLMLKQVHKGNKIGRTFKKKAWVHMVTEFNTRFGFQYGKVILKNRYNILRRQYCSIKFLLGQRGCSWDKTQQMVMADDRVWNTVFKARHFRKYRNKAIPYYIDMCIICGNETDCVRENIACPNLSSENETPGKNTGGAAMLIVNKNMMDEAHEETSERSNDKNLADQRKRRQSDIAQTFGRSKKVQRVDKGMSDVLREMSVAITTLRKEDSENSTSTKKVIGTLQAMPDMDEDLLLDACDFLEDERRAMMFLALDDTLRKKWLLRKLRP